MEVKRIREWLWPCLWADVSCRLPPHLFFCTMTSSAQAGKHGQLGESYSKLVSACCSSLIKRIAKVAPAANHCMIENIADEPVDFVHLIPPTGIPSAVSRSVLSSCEMCRLMTSSTSTTWSIHGRKNLGRWICTHATTLCFVRRSLIQFFSIIDTNYSTNSWYQTSRSIQQGKMDSPSRTTYTCSLPRWQVWSNVRSTSNTGTSRFLNP